jgi:hypothetical protein
MAGLKFLSQKPKDKSKVVQVIKLKQGNLSKTQQFSAACPTCFYLLCTLTFVFWLLA